MEKFSSKRRRKVIKIDDLVVCSHSGKYEDYVLWVVMPYNLVGTNVLEEPTAPVFRAILMPI
jgi:20S proteasome alpha/beta subunit